ncbi:hypothetical protein BDN72DRAFT_906776 [Pluteus cervinus]|uniref:Uncharacterized protein n=1 Tax=Pluteus cervinus TaxID=181527 RepID=A0ACD2ZZ93_9AGAR|nr:hypothetical protein BDN72DRAFT_906776 [Pluteus cervinus]
MSAGERPAISMYLLLEIWSFTIGHSCVDLTPPTLSSLLRSCSLVCRAWRSVSQPLLLSKFFRYQQYYSADQLLQTLHDNTRLVGFIKCFWIDQNGLLRQPNLTSS